MDLVYLSIPCCLQSLNLMGGSIFSKTRYYQKKKKKKKKKGFPLKPDDVILMSSNVHEWKGKTKVHSLISVFDATDH